MLHSIERLKDQEYRFSKELAIFETANDLVAEENAVPMLGYLSDRTPCIGQSKIPVGRIVDSAVRSLKCGYFLGSFTKRAGPLRACIKRLRFVSSLKRAGRVSQASS
jgi:hypothetical protein